MRKLIFVLLAAVSCGAQAGFFLVEGEKTAGRPPEEAKPDAERKAPVAPDSTPVVAPAPVAKKVSVRINGTVPPFAASGFGKNVPLAVAIRQIVPDEYSVVTTNVPSAELARTVDWKGGRSWVDVLTDALAGKNLFVAVDANKKIVVLLSEDMSDQSISQGSIWRIKKGEQIAEAFSAWAKDAGWAKVVWEPDPMTSDMDSLFPGSFTEAIVDAVKAINSSGLKLRVIFHEGNRVVQILEQK